MPKATHSRNPHHSESQESSVPLRWGILATGNIAKKFVLDLHNSGVGRAIACGSRTIEGARAFANVHGIPKAYGSYGELARDPEVDVVYIATPHPFHLEDALACMKNKKHVLCEKPLSLNTAQATEMFDTAQENNVFLMEALWTYFLPAHRQIRKWILEGAIGEVKLVDARFGFHATFDPKGRLFDPTLGGGALLDVGVYALSLAQILLGNKAPRVKASARMAETGVDESTSILLDWNSGARAQLSCSISHDMDNSAHIFGSKGTIVVPDFWKAASASLETSAGKTEFWDRRDTEGYDFQAKAVTESIRQGKSEDGMLSRVFSLRLATTMDSIRKQIGLVYPSEH